MTPERHHQVRACYEAALRLEPAAREAFLDRECQGDESIRQEVERLLSARERLPEFLACPLLGPAPRAFDPAMNPAHGMEGRQLHAYKLIREIGQGGMGSVYLAERVDGVYTKQVAIKLVRPSMNSAEILERFRREREILASLDHPNIARLIDGGSTDDGLPYFVMEFVEGQPINRWCDERKLNVSQRLELFRKVCDAVQYAHQHLVVHRDLKPGNILVTDDGDVKLLDFGIAKLLGPDLTGDLSATVTMTRLMTPQYASPEQVKGDAISTLTDVYSLGVILYELLTGHRPYRLLRAAMHEMARVISEEEPTRPSDVVTTTEEGFEGEPGKQPITPETVSEVREGALNRLRKRLQGDLDSILLTALRKEPSRRYSSVESFSEDLRRHLENRPVSAREDSVWYRVSRFVRRHPVGMAAGVVIALFLGGAILTALWQMRIALEAGRQKLSGREILAPQLVLWACLGPAACGGTVFFTRARLRRVAGALAGGMLFGATWIFKLRLDYSMGWWRTRFAETPDPFSLFSPTLMFLGIAVLGALVFLVSWRVARRFGWAGLAIFIAFVSAAFTFRDRMYWDRFMHMMTVSWGVQPLLADTALFVLGLTLGHAVMRIVSGPAKGDELSRRSS
ncbi:MAG: serine/threonine protein kinase [Acidobacteriia bacterium]|nr:serine/threonine protein kinase [Terriglobia bacterium]